MKVIAIVILLACFCRGALADDQATPSPTPVYLSRLARPSTLRRQEEIERRRVLEAQAKANRRSAVYAQAEARTAARVREQAQQQAQRQVEAEERAEAANATPHATSDLMSRMGFSAPEIAAQKAREQSLKPEAKKTTDVTSQAGRQSEQSRPAGNSGTLEDHLTRSHAEKPTSPSPAPNSGSH
jgi:membrane protein involved in colicin uptake